MSYYSSAARKLENPDYGREAQPRRERLSVHRGGGLDAQARKGVSAGFVHTIQVVLLAVFVIFGLGIARVAITAQTNSLLRQNAEMENAIAAMGDTNDSLRIERSSLRSRERIVTIATDNYGMHVAAADESLVLPDDVVAEDAVAEETEAPLNLVLANMD